MATRRKSFICQRSTWLALLVYAASFGIGLILFVSLASHSAIILPLTQLGQKQTPESISVKAQTRQDVTALEPELLSNWKQQAKAKNLIVSLPVQFQAKTVADVKLTLPDKVIALTFDDGPWPKSTEQVLNILQQHNIKATFFWIGQNVQNYPQLAQKVVADGQVIGNHTWHHWYRRMDKTTAASEIERTAAVIYQTTGVRTSLFRPPGGILNNGPADYAKLQNYGVVMWSDDSEDYNRPPVARLVKNVLRRARPGGIVLMHDGGGDRSHTVQALPLIIDALIKSGYHFVTVPELLEIKDKEQVAGKGVTAVRKQGNRSL